MFVAFLCSTTFLLVALFKPNWLFGINKAWMALGFVLSLVMSPIVMGIIFFGVFTPTSIIMRLFGRDELRVLRLFVLNYKRKLISKKKNFLTCGEMIHLLQGSAEGGGYSERISYDGVAIHEAGHAVVSIVESNFNVIPEFISIIENGDYLGLVRENSLCEQGVIVKTYNDLEKEIKTLLAGRAAEELFLGKENVAVESAVSDMNYASFCAIKLVKNGF